MKIINDENLTITKVAPLIRKRQLSPVELTKALLARIERLQPALNAFITVTPDLALKQARQAEGKSQRALPWRPPRNSYHHKGPFLHGRYPDDCRVRILRNFVPTENAIVVDRMQEAGTILLGKTNLHEFAFGATNVNPHYGPVHNPWDLGRISGGSSGGSAAAVSAGLCLASLGTDTGGSIRLPAAACGIVGLKPTFGLVPTEGVIPLSFSLDHVGPLCRCVEDAALMLGAIAGQQFSRSNPSAPKREGNRGLRVGVPKNYYFDRLQREVRHRVLAAHTALEKMGAKIQEVKLEGMQETANLVADIIFPEARLFIGNG